MKLKIFTANATEVLSIEGEIMKWIGQIEENMVVERHVIASADKVIFVFWYARAV